ncbi:MAG TPA: DedA family protein [Nitrospiraceae bacterium]|nr:DedA family protein [Nitrospiraceae bacterium]
MQFIHDLIQIFLHLDRHLDLIIRDYGQWTYAILFLIIFCETGLVVTPILPGDSLLFAAGAFAAGGSLEIGWLFCLLSIAAVSGNTVNYWIGYTVGPKIFHKENVRFLNRGYLDRTHRFYEEHGGITIVVARFLPIIRTFAPFVAGIGSMNHWRFSIYNITAGVAWVGTFVLGGYYFGNLPIVKQNFTFVILAIIIISILPALIGFLRHKFQSA